MFEEIKNDVENISKYKMYITSTNLDALTQFIVCKILNRKIINVGKKRFNLVRKVEIDKIRVKKLKFKYVYIINYVDVYENGSIYSYLENVKIKNIKTNRLNTKKVNISLYKKIN